MADGNLKLELEGALAEDIRAAAAACGLSVEDYVRTALTAETRLVAQAAAWDSADLDEDLAELAEYDRAGVGVPAEEITAWLASLGTDNELPRPRPRKLK